MTAPTEATGAGGAAAGSTQLGKRKKQRVRGSYLGTWLERAARHLQDEPDYEYLPHNPYAAPNIDACRLNGHCPPEPMSLPTYPFYSPAPQYAGSYWPPDCRYVQSAHKSIQVQRPRIKRKPSAQPNGALTNGAFNSAYMQPKRFPEESNEFTSLPPIVTSVGDTTSNSDLNNDKEETGSARRYSDPCLARLPAGADGDDGTDGEGEGSSCEQAGGSKLLMCLVDQINALKIANDRLNKDLQETRAELQSVRQQTSLWQKGSTSSLGAGQNHASLNNNGYMTAAPQYTPGVLSDLVREIREAARLREEALYARVRAMLDERTLNQSVLSSSFEKSTTDSRNYEDVKSELRAAEADKRRMNERLSRLEDELRQIRSSNGYSDGGAESESERLRLRRELGDARRDLQDARRAKQHADDNTLKLERLVTQMRSKFNGLHVTSPGPASLASASEAEAESPGARRTSTASNPSPHTTIVFGPVTDL